MAVTATLAQIRSGLVANLSSLGIQSTGYMLAEPMAPTIECFPGSVSYDATFGRGMDMVNFVVRVTVTVALDVPAQQLLDTFLAPSGANSVKTLIEADKTLGGTVKSLQVTEATGYRIAETKNGGIALSCDWAVEGYA